MADPNTPHEKERDAITGVETTGHEWDGLKELNNPAPRWWLIIFVVTIVWSVGYWVIYPAWPTISAHTAGIIEWTSHRQLAESQKELVEKRGAFATRIHTASLAEIRNTPDLYEFAREAGQAAFKQNCASCHGSGGQGSKGYPNLNDDDWLWGGKLEDIHHTISYGVRNNNPKSRNSMMLAFGRDGMLTSTQIRDVAAYVQRLHEGDKALKDDVFSRGEKIFADNCTSCHQAGGAGDRTQGAPRLNDAIWLYGGDNKTIIETITQGRGNAMPAWSERLDPDTVKELAIYVHSLGGAED